MSKMDLLRIKSEPQLEKSIFNKDNVLYKHLKQDRIGLCLKEGMQVVKENIEDIEVRLQVRSHFTIFLFIANFLIEVRR
jgi:hypothetical protein